MPRLASLVCVIGLLSSLTAGPSHAAAPPRVVDVTTDSAPGWIPTVDQEGRARATLDTFLAALDGGRTDEAYAMLTADNRREQTLAQFTAQHDKFRAVAGPVRERRVLKTTWTKDGPRVPL